MKNKYIAPNAEKLMFMASLDICEDASGVYTPGLFPGTGEEGDDDIIE